MISTAYPTNTYSNCNYNIPVSIYLPTLKLNMVVDVIMQTRKKVKGKVKQIGYSGVDVLIGNKTYYCEPISDMSATFEMICQTKSSKK